MFIRICAKNIRITTAPLPRRAVLHTENSPYVVYAKVVNARVPHQIGRRIAKVVGLMAVSLSSLEYLWIESVPLCQEVSKDLGLEDNVYAETVFRIEKHGFNVGRGLAHVVTRDQDRYLSTQLDTIKFVCKDLWILLFGKPVDSLKTNHIDTYVLTDSNFLMCQRMSTNSGPEETARRAAPYLWFPAGLIRGFLQGMGVKCKVNFDATDLPLIDFSIVI